MSLPAPLKHVAVREYVRTLVQDLPPGSPAPSERDLVQRFGVARMTVRQALQGLVDQGLLERVPGRGTFVAKPGDTDTRVLGFTDEMQARGRIAESQSLLLRRERIGPGMARALGMTEGDPVIHWQRLRRVDGVPMCLQSTYLPEVLLPGFLTSSMPTSLYADLAARGLRPNWAEDAIRPHVASEMEAQMLELPDGAAVLRIERRAVKDAQVVELSRSLRCTDRFPLRVQYDR